MRLLILGACGTFMAGIARIACQLGHDVTGVDQGMYSPIKEVLETLEMDLCSSYDPEILDQGWDLVLVANALSRGMPIIEKLLSSGIKYQSAPAWLHDNVLQHRKVIAIAGTHGKTTTTSIMTHVLRSLGRDVGYLVGGDANDLPHTAEVGSDELFVIEADEYDTAFFDKQSKFMHYCPTCLVINNIEFDHADIYSSIEEIKKTFYAVANIVPPDGVIVSYQEDDLLQNLVAPVSWCNKLTFGAEGDYQASDISDAGRSFGLVGDQQVTVKWGMLGQHNVNNALAVFAVCDFLQLDLQQVAHALQTFSGVKRRMQFRGYCNQMAVYEDFAHHPTAIALVIDALKSTLQGGKLTVLLQCGSWTMCGGSHDIRDLAQSLQGADQLYINSSRDLKWDISELASLLSMPMEYESDLSAAASSFNKYNAESGDTLLILGNGSLDKLFSGMSITKEDIA